MSAVPAILIDRPTGPTDERNCYTCASSPRWPNPAGCDQLNGGDGDKPVCDYCEASGIPVWCGGMLEGGVGRAYNVALASLPNFTLPGDLSPSARYWAKDVVSPEWTMDAQGMVRVPLDRAGIGVEVDREHIDRITVRTGERRA